MLFLAILLLGGRNMLAMSDTPIDQFIPYFAKASVPVAFLVPTPTGYEKSHYGCDRPYSPTSLRCSGSRL